jgi:hypothetical protein
MKIVRKLVLLQFSPFPPQYSHLCVCARSLLDDSQVVRSMRPSMGVMVAGAEA